MGTFGRTVLLVWSLACGCAIAAGAYAVSSFKFSQPYFLEVYSFAPIAGSGEFGNIDGNGTNAVLAGGGGIAIDHDGTIFFCEPGKYGQTVRKITVAGDVSTVAGATDQTGAVDGSRTGARFHSPEDVVIDPSGTLYIADAYNATIRKISTNGSVTTFAGSARTEGSLDGNGTNAQFRYPTGLTLDPMGNLYVADQLNHTIRKITPDGTVTTIAGEALQQGSSDGVGRAARFRNPRDIAIDSKGNLYVADLGNAMVRLVTPDGLVRTLAGGSPRDFTSGDGIGSAAHFGLLTSIAVNNKDEIFVLDSYKQAIRKVSRAGKVTTLVGVRFDYGGDSGAVAIDSENRIYVADPSRPVIMKAGFPEKQMIVNLNLEPFATSSPFIEVSTNLLDWSPIANSGWPFTVVDTNFEVFKARFYRARTRGFGLAE